MLPILSSALGPHSAVVSGGSSGGPLCCAALALLSCFSGVERLPLAATSPSYGPLWKGRFPGYDNFARCWQLVVCRARELSCRFGLGRSAVAGRAPSEGLAGDCAAASTAAAAATTAAAALRQEIVPAAASRGRCDEESLGPSARGPCEAAAGTRADEQVVCQLAAALEQMSARAPARARMTAFHSRRPPSLSIRDYLQRLSEYMLCSLECYVMALIYIDRVIQANPQFSVSVLSVHRLIFSALVIAAKFHDDVFYANEYYASVGGFKLCELNDLERSMLQLLDFRLMVTPQQFEAYRAAAARAATAAAVAPAWAGGGFPQAPAAA